MGEMGETGETVQGACKQSRAVRRVSALAPS